MVAGMMRGAALGLATMLCGTTGGIAGAQPAPDLNGLAQNASCLIEAETVVKLASQAQGILARIDVERGDHVKAGQIVATLESSVEEAMLKAARLKAGTNAVIRSRQTELSIAQAKLSRQLGLQAKNIAPLQTIEQAETDVASLESDLSQAQLDQQLSGIEADRIEASLKRRVMRSPIDGIVVSVDHAVGEYADLSTVIATLAQIQPLKVKLYLPLTAYPLVRVGMAATVRPAGTVAAPLPAKVTTKDQQIDAESNLFQTQLELPNPDAAIPAGLRCAVAFDPTP